MESFAAFFLPKHLFFELRDANKTDGQDKATALKKLKQELDDRSGAFQS